MKSPNVIHKNKKTLLPSIFLLVWTTSFSSDGRKPIIFTATNKIIYFVKERVKNHTHNFPVGNNELLVHHEISTIKKRPKSSYIVSVYKNGELTNRGALFSIQDSSITIAKMDKYSLKVIKETINYSDISIIKIMRKGRLRFWLITCISIGYTFQHFASLYVAGNQTNPLLSQSPVLFIGGGALSGFLLGSKSFKLPIHGKWNRFENSKKILSNFAKEKSP